MNFAYKTDHSFIMYRRSDKILKWFFLVLFIAYYLNITMFYHVHIENGVRIVHSHFVFGEEVGGVAGHNHSAAAYSAIHLLTHLVILLISFAFLLEILRRLLSSIFLPDSSSFFPSDPLIHYPLRAPPVYSPITIKGF